MSLFIELLQVSLGTRDELSRVPSVHEWEDIYDEAERQTVTGVLLDGLEKLPQEQLPPAPLKLQWIGITQLTEQTNLLHQRRASELTSKFRAVGFHTCVLKGLSSARRYPNPLRRECGDIDLWVIPSNVERLAVSGYRGCEYRKSVMAWMRSEFEVGHQMWHHVDVKIFDDVETEIHFHPSWLYNPWHRKRLLRFFMIRGVRLATVEAGKDGYVTTPADFDIVFQLTHMFHHVVEDGIGIRQVVDYYYTVRDYRLSVNGDESVSGERLAENGEAFRVIKGIGLYGFLRAMMYVLRELCGMKEDLLLCEPDEKGGKFLLNDILTSGNFGHERKGEALPRNGITRFTRMIKHYPSEGLWILPWKVEHLCWRLMNK